jgi:hypothetical protein
MKKTFLALLLLTGLCTAHAQDEQIDTFQYRQNGVDISFQGVVAKSNDELARLQLYEAMYPVVIVPRPVLHKAVRIGDSQSRLADSLSLVNARLLRQDALNTLEIEKKDTLIKYQKEFIAFSDNTNKMLNNSITALNQQLDECRQVAKDANKGLLGKKLWGILIGGGIGFGLGAVLGVIAAK